MVDSGEIELVLGQVQDQESFIQQLLADILNWPIEPDATQVDDISFEWQIAEELRAKGLDERIRDGKVYQLQPMDDNPWGVFIVEFEHEDVFTRNRGLTGPLRAILRGLVPSKQRDPQLASFLRENLLFICTHNYQHYRVAYFKSPTEEGKTSPLATFGWSPGEPNRTVCEYNLKSLEWPRTDIDADQWISWWAGAFDVEKVTKGFYTAYKDVFENVERIIKDLGYLEGDEIRMFTQSLFNRLMFIRFIEKKGWVEFNESYDYLRSLFEAGGLRDESLYNSRIRPLFFEGFAIPGRQQTDAYGNVPFLNGGLFDELDLDRKVDDLPEEVFAGIISPMGLLYRFNFTVEESTPVDIQVAVNPEMLGKVFEELVTERHEKGSYYTPRTIVSFMCRETLKGYLGGYQKLVDDKDSSGIEVDEARDFILPKLEAVKIVDPACGSGAYLVGMLHEIHAIMLELDTRSRRDARNDYERKLQIIKNNLYGVDIDPFAVQIARLRLWLSLAVDYLGDTPEPLPNLDFKIEQGDSLTALDPSGMELPDLFRRQRIHRYDELKKLHQSEPDHGRKSDLLDEINVLEQEIAQWNDGRDPVIGFDWRVKFAEVFTRENAQGFDIVIANPPYGAKVRKTVRDLYFDSRLEGAQSKDTYGLFMARGLQLMCPGGSFSFIVSDTWRTIRSHIPLRKRLHRTTIHHILDLPRWVFNAMVNTCVITLRNEQPEENHHIIVGDLHGIYSQDWELLRVNLNSVSDRGPDIQTHQFARYTYPQRLISSYDNYSFFIGNPKLYEFMSSDDLIRFGNIGAAVHGISTGNNIKYIRVEEGVGGGYPIIDDSMKMPLSEMRGLTDEEKVGGVDKDWQILTDCFVPLEKGGASEATEGWLANYYVPTPYYINWAIRAIRDMRNNPGFRWINTAYFFKPGLTFSISGIYAPTFRLNSEGVFEAKGSGIFCDTVPREVLLGLFCSRFAKYLFKSYIKHSVDTSGDDINDLRFPEINKEIETRISELVTSIIEKQKQDQMYPYHQYEQKEIDAIIYELYGLTLEEIREVELWYCRRYPIPVEAQGFLDEIKEKYAVHLAWCEEVLSKPAGYWSKHPFLEIISLGEGHTVEFKETLAVDARTGERNDGLVHPVLKTIAAFLNTSGGTLLIGVSDKGELMGLERDYQHCQRGHQNRDGLENKLRSLIRDRIDPAPRVNYSLEIEQVEGVDICNVEVKPISGVSHLDGEVFIRDGNQTIKLTGPKLTAWIAERTLA